MKYKYNKNIFLGVATVLFSFLNGCESPLKEIVFSEIDPNGFLLTEDGINSALAAAYSYSQNQSGLENVNLIHISELPTGYLRQVAGSYNGEIGVPYTEFLWDNNNFRMEDYWKRTYEAIRDANIVLNNVDLATIADNDKIRIRAEATAIRGNAYRELFSLFGGVPLILEDTDNTEGQPLATEGIIQEQIEGDLLKSINALPLEQPWGRITKGAAMGVLCKFYLNQKEWQKAADLALDIIELNKYELLPNYGDIYHYENEGNLEFLWVVPKDIGSGVAHLIQPIILPNGLGVPVFGARTYITDEFVNSFDLADTRDDLIITSYTDDNGSGETTGLGFDKSITFKYVPNFDSPNTLNSNDLTKVRYADILLSRAEALNELNGPSQIGIDLINQVRRRAQVSDISIGDFTQETLKDFILQERKFEFYFEDKGREDLIRNGSFISQAVDRGKSPRPGDILFPIPQVEIDANDALD